AVLAQAASRCISANESAPPDTATAPGHGAGAIARANSVAGSFALARRLARDLLGSVRVFAGERAKGHAAFFDLTHRDQRLAELEHASGTARACRVLLHLLGEGVRGIGVVLLHEGDVAQPI